MNDAGTTVAEFKSERQEFNPTPDCPACRGWDFFWRYSEAHVLDGVEVTRFDDKPDPHLVMTCGRCDFQWEMKVAHP